MFELLDLKLRSILLQIFVVRGDGHKLQNRKKNMLKFSRSLKMDRITSTAQIGLATSMFVIPCTGMWGQVYSKAQGC